jgi:hypothetical protein
MFAILSASALGWRSFSRSRTTDRTVPSTRGIGTKASGMNVQICFGWGNLLTSIAFGRSGGCSTGVGDANGFPIKKMAGHFQGYHWFPNKTGSVEVFWRADGWWWRLRAPGCPPEGAPIGPFLTSTDAYLNASGGAVLMPRPIRLDRRPALT